MKNKLLGYVFIFAIFAAAISLIYYQQTTSNVPNLTGVNHKLNKTYTNDEYGFRIKYPSTYVVQTDSLKEYAKVSDADAFENKATSIVSINLPASLYGNTNLMDSYVFIGAAKDIPEEECKDFELGTENATEPKLDTVKGVTFTKSDYVGTVAGAATFESKTYRAMRNNICYEINLNVQVGNIKNYDAEIVSEINKDEIWNRLNNILSTFTFTN